MTRTNQPRDGWLGSLLQAAVRITFYCVLVLGLQWTPWSPALSVALFVLATLVFELAFVKRVAGWKSWAYLLCLVGMAVSGVFLVLQANHVAVSRANGDHFANCFSRTLEQIDGPAVAVDQDGRILAANPPFQRLTGHDGEGLVGAELTKLFTPEQTDDFLRSWRSLVGQLRRARDPVSGGRTERVTLKNGDGTTQVVDVETLAFHLRDEGRVITILLIRKPGGEEKRE